MRVTLIAIGFCAALLLVGEVFARIVLGLGTPPLIVTDPEIEYMFRPNQDVRPFHNRQIYNEAGMRSGPVPQPGEAEVILVLGDSVVNGSTALDQAELATEIVSRRLSGNGRKVFVGNVSAISWGPGNQLAYLRRYGLFGASAVVLVASSGDAHDVPSFGPLDPDTFPTRAPALALSEAASLYIPRYLPFLWHRPEPSRGPVPAAGAALGDLRALISEVRTVGAPICAVHHWTRTELETGPTEDGLMLLAALGDAAVPTIEDGPALVRALAQGEAPFRDDVHLTASGQSVLADQIEACISRIREDRRGSAQG